MPGGIGVSSGAEDAGASGAKTVTAAVLVIGDEILSGRTKDKNIGFIADHLNAIGIELVEVRIVGDSTGAIVEALNALRSRYDYVFTTGGIGPTHDDITADAVAEAFSLAIEEDPTALALIAAHCERRGVPLTPPRRRMARVPTGATLIKNAISAAPGFMLDNVIVMAGVPSVMEAMLEDATQYLRTGPRMHSFSIVLARPEGDVAEILTAAQAAHADVAMGSYPSYANGIATVELVLRSRDPVRLATAACHLEAALRGCDIL
ncbi:MAG: competence/damage-inducible protein A [Hyphomicrobiaceae bacterium]